MMRWKLFSVSRKAAAAQSDSISRRQAGRDRSTVRHQWGGRDLLQPEIVAATQRVCDHIEARRRLERPHESRLPLRVAGATEPFVITRFEGNPPPTPPQHDAELDFSPWHHAVKLVAWLVGGVVTEPGLGPFDVCLSGGETWSVHTAKWRPRDGAYSFRIASAGADAHLLVGHPRTPHTLHDAEMHLVPARVLADLGDRSSAIHVTAPHNPPRRRGRPRRDMLPYRLSLRDLVALRDGDAESPPDWQSLLQAAVERVQAAPSV